MGFQGSVESFSLADVFQNLAMNQQTGTLRIFISTGAERHIHFETGQVRYLSHGSQKPLLLGEIVVGRGIASEEQVAQALARQTESKEALGASLLALGFLTQEQIDELVRHQIEEEIYDLFGWEKAQFEFNDGPPQEGLFADQVLNKGKGPGLTISHLIMEAARRVDEWDQLKQQVPSFREIFISDDTVRKAVTAGEIEADAVEKRVLSKIDGARDVEDVIQDACLFRFEVLTSISGFLRANMIRPASPKELGEAAARLDQEGLHGRRAKVLERQLALGGDNPTVRRALAEDLAGEGQTDKAAIHFSVLADADLQRGNEDGAATLYRRILQIVPQHMPSRERLGAIYAKRGQKREAVIQYQELVKVYQNNKQFPEARGACLRALECEPQNTELRLELIQVFTAEGNRAGAAREQEILGDQFARQAQVKPAADHYRKAMQLMPSQGHLKKKLASVMLTQEDRRARTKRTLFAGAAVALVLLGMGFMVFRELRVWRTVKRVKDQHKSMVEEARDLEGRLKFQDAVQKYREAKTLYQESGLLGIWSPVVRGDREADLAIAELETQRHEAQGKFEMLRGRGEQDSKSDLGDGEAAVRDDNLYAAQETLEKVLKNEFASAEDKEKAGKLKQVNDAKIRDFEECMRLFERPPREAFKDTKEEFDRKLEFFKRFIRVPKLAVEMAPGSEKAAKFFLPIKFRTKEVNVQVFLDEGMMGGAGRESENIFRYDSTRPGQFKLAKKGFQTVSLSTQGLGYEYEIRLNREPSRVVDLGVQPSGAALFEDGLLWIGTSSGGLIQIQRDLSKKIFTFPGAAGLKNAVYGVYSYAPGSGKNLLLFTTHEGDAVRVNPGDGKFLGRVSCVGKEFGTLRAPPAVASLKLAGNQTFLLASVDKRVRVVHVETGQAFWPELGKASEELPRNASSMPLFLESSGLIVVGCEDGDLYGIDITSGKRKKSWPGNKSAITGQPVVYDNKYLLACTQDGSFHIFDLKGGASEDSKLNFGGEVLGPPAIQRTVVFFGTQVSDGFFAFDMEVRRKRLNLTQDQINGGVTTAPLIAGERIFFGTDAGSFYCLELVDGNYGVAWSYPSASSVAGPPIAISENRIAFFCVNGKIYVFDE